MAERGRLIVLEGGDGAGKATQVELLREALAKQGTVAVFSFPQYKKTEFGKLLGRSLAGDFGDFVALSPYWAALPYMLDRASAKDEILAALEQGDVLCDRYTFSNTYQTGKLPPAQWDDFARFLERAEYAELGLPMADLTFYLSVTPEIAAENVRQKNQRDHLDDSNTDAYEQDIEFQRKVREAYLHMTKRADWHVIDCLESGAMRSRESIHEEIMSIVGRLAVVQS
jgi:dTMP kinase